MRKLFVFDEDAFDKLSSWPRLGPLIASGKSPRRVIKFSRQKYFALFEFGICVYAARPDPPKGRSYVITNAGRDAVDAGGVGARGNRRAR